MASIWSWLGELMWESKALTTDMPDGVLTARVLVGPDPPIPLSHQVDLVLTAEDENQVKPLLDHLASLGTVGRVILSGVSELPRSSRRQLSRTARQQRKNRLRVELA
ncbi:MAG: hypothetical protein JW797_14035 [Bradymonadales bacterium]|nr:hypothetical protein [Bradymonadales bacterium]